MDSAGTVRSMQADTRVCAPGVVAENLPLLSYTLCCLITFDHLMHCLIGWLAKALSS